MAGPVAEHRWWDLHELVRRRDRAGTVPTPPLVRGERILLRCLDQDRAALVASDRALYRSPDPVTRSATPSSVGWSSYRGCGLPSRGAPAPIGALEPANLAVLGILLAELDSRSRDWVAYHRGSVEFHLRNAAAWANEAVGADLARQVDPDFVPGSSTPGTRASSASAGAISITNLIDPDFRTRPRLAVAMQTGKLVQVRHGPRHCDQGACPELATEPRGSGRLETSV